jgi:hypothetical protein
MKWLNFLILISFLIFSGCPDERSKSEKELENLPEKEQKAKIFLRGSEKKEVLKKIAELSEKIKKEESAELYAERGSQYISLWKSFEALEDFKKAIELDPVNLRAHKKIAATYYFLGNDEESLVNYIYLLSLLERLSIGKSGGEKEEIVKEMQFIKEKSEMVTKAFTKNEKQMVEGDFIELRNKKGCYSWNPFPVEGEWFEWSGKCKDGKATGKGTLIDSGGVETIGAMLEGKINGKAEKKYIKYSNKKFDKINGMMIYNGNLKDNLESGFGIMLYPNGVRYEGMFENGIIKGEGKFIYPEGGELDGVFNGIVPVSIKSAKCKGEDTEYVIFRSKEGKWRLPVINCPIRK